MSDGKPKEGRTDEVQAVNSTPGGEAERKTAAGPVPQSVGARAMQSVGDIGSGAVAGSRNIVRGAIGATEEVGTGVVDGAAHIATDLVHGITDVGYEIRNGATGLIGAIGDIGSAAVNTTANLLVDVVDGLRQVVSAAVRGNHRGEPHAGVHAEPRAAEGQHERHEHVAHPAQMSQPGATTEMRH